MRKSSRVYIFKDVIFHEHLFPCPTLFSFAIDEPGEHAHNSEPISFRLMSRSNVPSVRGPNQGSHGSLLVSDIESVSSKSLHDASINSPFIPPPGPLSPFIMPMLSPQAPTTSL